MEDSLVKCYRFPNNNKVYARLWFNSSKDINFSMILMKRTFETMFLQTKIEKSISYIEHDLIYTVFAKSLKINTKNTH